LFLTSASHAALSHTAAVQGLAFDRAVDWLADLALLDAQRDDIHNPPRYELHPLVRAFSRVKLAERPWFEAEARARWVEWYRQLAEQVGFCWDDLGRLEQLDPEHETLQEAITWTFEHGRYADTIALIEGVRYYYNVRGLWDERLTIHLMRAEAARRIGDRADEALALAYHVEIRSKQGGIDEAAGVLERLQELGQATDLPDMVVFELQHALALYARAHGDLATAERIWRQLLALSARIGGQPYVVNRRWLAVCSYQQGQLAEAQRLFRESLRDAAQIGDQRSVMGNTLRLAAIDLDQGHLADAEAALAACRPLAEQFQDRRRLGEFYRLSARLHSLRGDHPAARAALASAIDLFERLGMRRELAEARAALEQLS
jgi:tetratricopeptide (TPR) repeat protein